MKNPLLVVSVALLLCFAFGCQNKADKAELEDFRAQAKLEEQNKELVKHFAEELNKGNVEIFNEVCAPEYGIYSPSNNSKPMSREEELEALEMTFKVFPDVNWRMEKLFVVGDTAIIRIVFTGTYQGEFEGIPATGKKVEASGITIIRIEKGKFVEQWEEFDMLGLMQQLGMELKPKEVKK